MDYKNVCVGAPFPLAALPSAGLGEADFSSSVCLRY